MNIEDIAELIRGGSLRSVTLQLREAVSHDDLREAKRLKSAALPAVMPAAHCSEGHRDAAHVTELTGLAMADFDHVPPERMADARSRLMADRHVLLMHTSPSGTGLHVFFTYDPKKDPPLPSLEGREETFYLQAFRQGCEYLARVACLDYDTAQEPMVHLACICHDEEVYFNPEAEPLVPDMTQPLPKRGTRNRMLTPEGETAQTEWQSLWTTREVCNYARQLHDRHDLYQPGNRHCYLVKLAFLLSDLGVDETEARGYLQSEFPDYEDEPMHRLIGDCYRRATASHGRLRMPSRKANGRPRTTAKDGKKATGDRQTRPTQTEEVHRFVSAKPLRFDVLSQRIQQQQPDGNWTDLTDREENDLYVECSRELGVNIQPHIFRNVMRSSAVPRCHPLRQYILGLPKWEPSMSDYITQVLDMVKVNPRERELWHWAARKWLVAMVAGWMSDEVVNHEVLVLIGRQGIFKTSWIEALMPPQLRQYCSKQSPVRFSDKDELLRSAEYGLVNLDEIDSMSENELNGLKSLVSATDINVRASYGRNKERRVRVASYAASGNKDAFLTDQTGNRRWLPFHVEGIDNPMRHPIPHDGLYAQAWHLAESDFKYWFDAEDIERMRHQTDSFATESSEEQLLPVYFEPALRGQPGAVMLTAAEISAKLTIFGNIRRPMNVRQLGILLRRKGYEPTRSNGRKGFLIMEKPTDTVNAERHLFALNEQSETGS